MRAAALSRDELQPRSPGGGWPGLALSVLVHAGLLAVLLWGFRWETPSTDMVSAELWAATPQAAPAAAVTPAALPPPAPPVPVPPPRAVTPPPKPVPAIVTPDADIALEKARKAKAGGVAAGAPGGGGGGPSASYAGRLIQAIKPNIVFGETLTGNPAAEVEVRAGPTGSIIGRTLVKSSGHPEWDEAVLRAIDRTATLPKDTDGRVPPRLTITFRPRD